MNSFQIDIDGTMYRLDTDSIIIDEIEKVEIVDSGPNGRFKYSNYQIEIFLYDVIETLPEDITLYLPYKNKEFIVYTDEIESMEDIDGGTYIVFISNEIHSHEDGPVIKKYRRNIKINKILYETENIRFSTL